MRKFDWISRDLQLNKQFVLASITCNKNNGPRMHDIVIADHTDHLSSSQWWAVVFEQWTADIHCWLRLSINHALRPRTNECKITYTHMQRSTSDSPPERNECFFRFVNDCKKKYLNHCSHQLCSFHTKHSYKWKQAKIERKTITSVFDASVSVYVKLAGFVHSFVCVRANELKRPRVVESVMETRTTTTITKRVAACKGTVVYQNGCEWDIVIYFAPLFGYFDLCYCEQHNSALHRSIFLTLSIYFHFPQRRSKTK